MCQTAAIKLLLACIVLVSLLAGCSQETRLPLLASDAVILAFGDSLTFGTGASESQSYPAVLAKLTGLRVVNAGVPGEISATGVARLPDVLEKERPALLILCHGGNDLLARQGHKLIADNLRTMIRSARDRGVSVMLLSVPTLGLTLKPPPLYDEVAREFGLPIERKTLSKILGSSSLKSDHIHPNAAGYSRLAAAVTQLLHDSGALK
jgi:lysophospholipase L1-like esterase